MHANGTFRIMQVADLHYSVGDGFVFTYITRIMSPFR